MNTTFQPFHLHVQIANHSEIKECNELPVIRKFVIVDTMAHQDLANAMMYIIKRKGPTFHFCIHTVLLYCAL